MPDQNSRNLAADELDWQAFRYISAEMSADDSAAFEKRLADDQAAREAVARSGELIARLFMSSALKVTPASVFRSQMVAPAATVAALVLVCLSLGFFAPTPGNEPTLVSLWALPPADLAEDEDDDEFMTTDETDDLALPGWLLAALGTDAGAESGEEN